MAVYTDVADDELRAFIALYDIGEVLSCKGIAEGVENSNFLLTTERGNFILTLYEKRVAPEDLLHVVDGDRDYVAAEISAFLIAWLTQLTCPVINRPATNSLMGAPHAAEGWVAIAARAGLRLPWTRRMFPAPPEPAWPLEAITVSVLGDRCFGDVDPALADQACRLAAAANVELLAVTFSHAAADATFLGAHLWSDVSLPELASALLARFVPAAARPAGIAAEAGA